MRLSEAIVLGSMMKPQAFGSMFDGERTCALGAAKDAIGNLEGPLSVSQIWPWALADKRMCPACGWVNRGTLFLILHLNDFHRWPREEIADWVAEAENDRALQNTVPEVLAAV